MKRGPAHGNRRVYCGHTLKAKIRYRTLADAKIARSALAERDSLRIYGCPECGGYHLTSWALREDGNPRTAWRPPGEQPTD